MNTLGYELIRLERVTEAIEIFKLNVQFYPDYSNAYSGLGEAYQLSGNPELAIENFNKSLELYPENKRIKQKLKELKK